MMTQSNYINIYSGNFISVRRIIMELENIHVFPIVKDQTESARLAGFGGGITPGIQQVYVHQDEYDQSIKIIESLRSKL